MKSACDAHDPTYYDVFKAWCDEYFYIKHRKETRGVGGIFYDYRFIEMDTNGRDNFEGLFQFTKDVGLAFLKGYSDIARRRHRTPYSIPDLAAQFKKRTRYAEFNLVYDRGIKFGLNTGGNIDAMFMSLPPVCGWE
jgi:coproporphyrinogen III oxidase